MIPVTNSLNSHMQAQNLIWGYILYLPSSHSGELAYVSHKIQHKLPTKYSTDTQLQCQQPRSNWQLLGLQTCASAHRARAAWGEKREWISALTSNRTHLESQLAPTTLWQTAVVVTCPQQQQQKQGFPPLPLPTPPHCSVCVWEKKIERLWDSVRLSCETTHTPT